ncbi:3'-5' exonuclease [Pseudochrobactrum lubricantis]|uniref:3'-5' exonuclease n=1 Tax=Pseudochrobactrum lubricantis TaxID=558172 RepID=UPI0035D8A93A
MNSKSVQFDMFDTKTSHPVDVPSVANTRKSVPDNEEALAQQLEETGRFRILRKLTPRPIVRRKDSPFERLAVLIDTETTGLSHVTDQIIEVGAVAFTYNDDGAFGDVVGVFSGMQQPTIPIPAEITRLTGITDAMVQGQTLDLRSLEAMIEPADLIIAHNAGFDRPFCEKLSPLFASKAWACSVAEVQWSGFGFEGSKLGYLVGQSGLFHNGHRATDDCHALLEVLIRPAGADATVPFTELLKSSRKARVRIYAENSPFDMKNHLKKRGYRWSDGNDGRPKAWWVEVDEDNYADELHYLQTEIYRWKDAEPLSIRLTAQDRFKSR